MPYICFDEDRFAFPSVDRADEEGLVLLGGRVTPERVIEAYKKGIFPWYNDDSLPLWWSPDPRFVLLPEELHVSRSMKKLMARSDFSFRLNTAFEQVIDSCAAVKRAGQEGTWITNQMKESYVALHRTGHAHSAETWRGGELVGGVYGLRMGAIFFGESMFSNVNNASKFAFISYVQSLSKENVRLIDCQVYTAHAETLGAKLISRNEYLELLKQHIQD